MFRCVKKSSLAGNGFEEKKVRWKVEKGRDEGIGKERNGDRSGSIEKG